MDGQEGLVFAEMFTPPKVGNPRIVTLALAGIMSSYKLFLSHIKSMMWRSKYGDGDVFLLEYPSRFDLDAAVLWLSEWIQSVANREYDVIYLDGVGCGARVIAETLIRIRRCGRHPEVLSKVIFSCINGVVSSGDMRGFINLLGFLPLIWLNPILTPVLRVVYRYRSRRECERYEDFNKSVHDLNEDIITKIGISPEYNAI